MRLAIKGVGRIGRTAARIAWAEGRAMIGQRPGCTGAPDPTHGVGVKPGKVTG